MPTFITIGYGDRAGYEETDQTVRDAAHAHDARLRANGAVMGVAGEPVQVRNHDDRGMETARGPFLRSELPVAGFALIEAASAEEAAELVAGTPVRSLMASSRSGRWKHRPRPPSRDRRRRSRARL